jgi:hypothetical protein
MIISKLRPSLYPLHALLTVHVSEVVLQDRVGGLWHGGSKFHQNQTIQSTVITWGQMEGQVEVNKCHKGESV